MALTRLDNYRLKKRFKLPLSLGQPPPPPGPPEDVLVKNRYHSG